MPDEGADRVKGNQGRDRLYGNAGPDKLFGGKGPDTLEGGVSDDWLKGQKGDDALDGGPGTDTCYQDQGSGSETSCELPAAPVVAPPVVVPKPPAADLAVEVRPKLCVYNDDPCTVPFEAPIAYTVTVTNNGPAAATYGLSPSLAKENVLLDNCSVTTEPSGAQASLAAGDSKQFDYSYDCDFSYLDLRLTVTVAPTGGTVDPVSANDSDDLVIWVR